MSNNSEDHERRIYFDKFRRGDVSSLTHHSACGCQYCSQAFPWRCVAMASTVA